MNKKLLADLISEAVCNAICEPKLKRRAKEWLGITRKIPLSEIVDPPTYSYIYCCRGIGINWYRLQVNVKEACELDIPESDFNPRQFISSPLFLVHNSELGYNNKYGGTTNSNRTSNENGGIPKLHLQVVPTPERASPKDRIEEDSLPDLHNHRP